MNDDSITTADLVYERDTTIAERIAEALAGAAQSGMTMDQLEAALPSNRPGAIKNVLSTMVRRREIVRMVAYPKGNPSKTQKVFFAEGQEPSSII